MFYKGPQELAATAERFVREGLAADEPVMVALSGEKNARLRHTLGQGAAAAVFADMGELGRNPSRVLPAWRSFVEAHSSEGRPLRGIGEPVWPGRSGPELEECALHEALVNVAFDDTLPFWLLCPYDASGLDRRVLRAAVQNHPFTVADAQRQRSRRYRGAAAASLAGEMAAPDRVEVELEFGEGSLPAGSFASGGVGSHQTG